MRVHATDDFRRGAYRERREVARSMAEIGPDPPGWLIALRFDIDSEGGGAAWMAGSKTHERRVASWVKAISQPM